MRNRDFACIPKSCVEWLEWGEGRLHYHSMSIVVWNASTRQRINHFPTLVVHILPKKSPPSKECIHVVQYASPLRFQQQSSTIHSDESAENRTFGSFCHWTTDFLATIMIVAIWQSPHWHTQIEQGSGQSFRPMSNLGFPDSCIGWCAKSLSQKKVDFWGMSAINKKKYIDEQRLNIQN